MLAGIPLALKGNWALKGVPMNTQRTGLLHDHTPSWTATVVRAALLSFNVMHACMHACAHWRG
jgi:Asp-tRNA(Asn)/Glu-tRNA(Gln) amidotransferase A subunit family amidase